MLMVGHWQIEVRGVMSTCATEVPTPVYWNHSMQKFSFASKICILSTDREAAVTCPWPCSRYLAELDESLLNVFGSQQYAVPAWCSAMLEGFGTRMTQWR